MKLYKISQEVNNDYDTYDSAVVCAESEDEARKIHPRGEYDYEEVETESITFSGRVDIKDRPHGSWTSKKHVKVEYLGEANESIKKGVVVASYTQ